MGACFSRSKGRGSPPLGSATNCTDRRGGPPPELEPLQEETVKEVLSETPKLKAPRLSREELVGIIEKEGGGGIVFTGEARDDRSEVTSEVCSVSEALSASTALTEVTGEEKPLSVSPVKLQRKRSTSSSDNLLKRERMTGSVAAVGCRSGRSSPSPAKRREGGGAGRTREASSGVRSRGGALGSALCRDPGERSGRRSVSPAPKRTAVGQCRSGSTVMANGRSSPRRAATGAAVEGAARFGSVGRRMEQNNVERNNGGGSGSASGSGGKETLENPLVSLECFIFL